MQTHGIVEVLDIRTDVYFGARARRPAPGDEFLFERAEDAFRDARMRGGNKALIVLLTAATRGAKPRE